MQRLHTVFSSVACLAPSGLQCCLQEKRNSFLLIRHSTGRSVDRSGPRCAALPTLRSAGDAVLRGRRLVSVSQEPQRAAPEREGTAIHLGVLTYLRVPSVTACLSIARNSCPARMRSAPTVLANRHVSSLCNCAVHPSQCGCGSEAASSAERVHFIFRPELHWSCSKCSSGSHSSPWRWGTYTTRQP